ncbi:unnamed protein product, partial [Brenthis ino]
MSQTVARAVSFLVFQILLYNSLTLSMGQFNFFNRPQFRTISRSPSNGPMFLNAKTYLTVLPSNVPVVPCFETTFTPEPLILTEKTATILHKVHKRDEEVDDVMTIACDSEEVLNNNCDFECDLEEILPLMAAAQIISYVPRSSVSQNIVGNINGYRPVNVGIPIARNVPNTIAAIPATNGVSLSPANIANGMMNGNLMNGQVTNSQIVNVQPANAQVASNQLANAQLVNAVNENAAMITNQEIAAINKANLANAGNANLANLAGKLANINGNVATFDLGNAFTVTSGSPGNQAFGIQLLADALEIGGTVAVNGQIPIFGTVALNGNLPTDGTASVSYSCDQPAASTTV